MTMAEIAERVFVTDPQRRGLETVRRDFTVGTLEVRAATADSPIREFTGHASVTGQPYEMYGGPDKGGWNETIVPGAFKRALGRNPDVAFLINHEGMTLARTTAGTLHLTEDKTGLAVRAQLDTRDTNANNLAVQMENGNINEMSFAFRVTDQEWRNADGETVDWWDTSGIDRQIQAVDINKGDVSAVNYGANPYTDASIRSLADTLRAIAPAEMDEDEIRGAMNYLRTLLPTPSLPAMPHEYTEHGTYGFCAICGLVPEIHDMLMPQANAAPDVGVVHADLVEAQQRAVRRHADLVAALLQ